LHRQELRPVVNEELPPSDAEGAAGAVDVPFVAQDVPEIMQMGCHERSFLAADRISIRRKTNDERRRAQAPSFILRPSSFVSIREGSTCVGAGGANTSQRGTKTFGHVRPEGFQLRYLIGIGRYTRTYCVI